MDPEIEVLGFLNLADARFDYADARIDLAAAVSDTHTDFRREIMAVQLTFWPGCQSVRLTRHPCGRRMRLAAAKSYLADTRLNLADARVIVADVRTESQTCSLKVCAIF